MPGLYEFIKPDLSPLVERVPTHALSSDLQGYADGGLTLPEIESFYPQLDAAARQDISNIAANIDAAVRLHGGQLFFEAPQIIQLNQTNQWVPIQFAAGAGKGSCVIAPDNSKFLFQRIPPNAVPNAWTVEYQFSAETDATMRLECIVNRLRGGDVQMVGTNSIADYLSVANSQAGGGGFGIQEGDEVSLWLRSLAGTGNVEMLACTLICQADWDSDRQWYVRRCHNILMNAESGHYDEAAMRSALQIA